MQSISYEPIMKLPFHKKVFLRPIAKRFIGGENLEEAIQALHHLQQQGFKTSLDYLGESVKNEAEACEATEEYIKTLQSLKNEGLDKNISIKLTQLGLDIDETFARENLVKVVQAAGEMGGFVRVDMEDSAHTEQTLRMVTQVHKQYAHVGVVLQAMLRRTPEDVVEMLKEGIGVRL
ncbi:MAG: proline dehydrogenase family protein, partial [Deltaproteobacteria bacterium]|nr:proline dehydrogenase family protein [Deltaproteobacteria bacterium]